MFAYTCAHMGSSNPRGVFFGLVKAAAWKQFAAIFPARHQNMAKQRTVEEVTEEVMAYVKPIVHVAFIPVVILVGGHAVHKASTNHRSAAVHELIQSQQPNLAAPGQFHHPRPPHGAGGWTGTPTHASTVSTPGSVCSAPWSCAAGRPRGSACPWHIVPAGLRAGERPAVKVQATVAPGCRVPVRPATSHRACR
ncbi:hypothetical protein QJQ45_018636 [Haematococcus lacustris]|nr:hypothetical protein QJQ45_018636 [Haematococcus lacustris]